MILSLCLLGTEVFRLELGATPPNGTPNDPDLVAVHRHAGEFGFGASPARPYWSADPDEAPAVAREA